LDSAAELKGMSILWSFAAVVAAANGPFNRPFKEGGGGGSPSHFQLFFDF
jgi:hypothetical protein